MRTLGSMLGFLILFFVGSVLAAVAGLPHWIVRFVVLLLLLMLLRWADDRLTGGTGGRAIGWALRTVWAGLSRWAGRHGVRLPQPPARPVPVPVASTYTYTVPTSEQTVVVDVLPAAVYTYYDVRSPAPYAYIGKAINPTVRHESHVKDGRPFTGLPRDVQWYPCECVALKVEAAAIQTLRPMANIMHNNGRP